MKIPLIVSLSQVSLEILKAILELEKEYPDSEEISQKSGVEGTKLGSALAAISKQTFNGEKLIVPFGKRSKQVERIREGKKVTISKAFQVWKVDENISKNKEEIIKRIEQVINAIKQ